MPRSPGQPRGTPAPVNPTQIVLFGQLKRSGLPQLAAAEEPHRFWDLSHLQAKSHLYPKSQHTGHTQNSTKQARDQEGQKFVRKKEQSPSAQARVPSQLR